MQVHETFCVRSSVCSQLKVVPHPLPEFTRGQKPGRLDDGAFAMDPFRLDAIEPGALGGQPAWNDAHASFTSSSFPAARSDCARAAKS